MLKTSALLVVVLFCAACPKQTNDDKKNPPTEQTPAKTEPVLTCEADDDCELYAFVAESGSDRFCCDTCGGDVANSDWIQSKVDACETRRKAKTADCPVIRCTQLNLVARCVDKVCKAVTPSAKPTFPPKDLTCKTDDDCTLSTRGHDGDYCCSKCSATPVSTAWESAVNTICTETFSGDYHSRCPHLSCQQGPDEVAKCVSGTCSAVPADAKP